MSTTQLTLRAGLRRARDLMLDIEDSVAESRERGEEEADLEAVATLIERALECAPEMRQSYTDL